MGFGFGFGLATLLTMVPLVVKKEDMRKCLTLGRHPEQANYERSGCHGSDHTSSGPWWNHRIGDMHRRPQRARAQSTHLGLAPATDH